MKILSKIKAWSDFISTPQGAAEGARIQGEAVDAIINGIGSPEWETYMKNYHSNSAQLQRLLGNDQIFMASDWGRLILAYIASDSTCGGGTTTSTGRHMADALKDQLDSLNPATDPNEATVVHPPELVPFI